MPRAGGSREVFFSVCGDYTTVYLTGQAGDVRPFSHKGRQALGRSGWQLVRLPPASSRFLRRRHWAWVLPQRQHCTPERSGAPGGVSHWVGADRPKPPVQEVSHWARAHRLKPPVQGVSRWVRAHRLKPPVQGVSGWVRAHRLKPPVQEVSRWVRAHRLKPPVQEVSRWVRAHRLKPPVQGVSGWVRACLGAKWPFARACATMGPSSPEVGL
jgi:hypothetical protein